MQELSEIRLDEESWHDIVELYTTNPIIKISRDSLLGALNKCPPTITLKSMPGQISKELELLLVFKWQPAMEMLYDNLKMRGICPYYYEKIPGTIHQYPVVPPMDSGYITITMGDDHKLKFKWYYYGSTGMRTIIGNQYDSKMQFYFESQSSMPNTHGKYRSAIHSLLKEYRTFNILRESTEIGSWNGVRPYHVIEYHPAKNRSGDDELTTLETFGEKVAGNVMMQTEMFNRARMRVRTDELMQAIQTSHAANTGAYHTRYDNKESNMSRTERQRSAFDGNRMLPLPADRIYKQTGHPVLVGDLEKARAAFDLYCASIMDFPLEMIQPQSKQRGANISGNARYWNERIKHWAGIFETFYKQALISIYGNTLQEGLDSFVTARTPLKKQLQTYIATDLKVEIPCSPMIDTAALQMLYEKGYIAKEVAGEHIFSNFGLPYSQMEIVTDPNELAKRVPLAVNKNGTTQPTSVAKQPAAKKAKVENSSIE